MVKKVPVQFEASDGREFATEAEAKRHEQFIDAKHEYDVARTHYAKLLWESQTTADGERFEMTLLHDYWYISPIWDRIPRVSRVSFYLHNCDLDDYDEAVIIQTQNGKDRERYRLKELYYHERNARKALVEVRRKRLAEWTKETDQLEAELKPTPNPR